MTTKRIQCHTFPVAGKNLRTLANLFSTVSARCVARSALKTRCLALTKRLTRFGLQANSELRDAHVRASSYLTDEREEIVAAELSVRKASNGNQPNWQRANEFVALRKSLWIVCAHGKTYSLHNSAPPARGRPRP